MKTDELRRRYLTYFQEKSHNLFRSDSLIPLDPTVLFTSAGMNQFKAYFLGEKKDVRRAASCQKCLRTGDLDEVGRTAFHHTFFEMLGNFSFGDYFKKEAIEFAWEFLTKEVSLTKEVLWVSVYSEDEEAYRHWREHIGIDPGKIVKLGAKNNFWPANAPADGPNGPCGPCSEIFFDKGKDVGCGKPDCSPACDCGRFVEIWNLVFTQFNRVGVNELENLSQQNIDTGMGLERMASVLQQKESNFEIDILAPVVEEVKKVLGKKSLMSPQGDCNFIHAIVDHARAAAFSVCDGVFPSNEDRGYIIRKLIRKASYHGYTAGKKEPFLYQLIPLFAHLMRDPYPELWDKKEDVSSVILAEEEKFLKTIEVGRNQFHAILAAARKENRTQLRGEEVFKLYDTYGFPLELIKELSKDSGFTVEEEEFSARLEKQKELSRGKSMFDDTIFSSSDLSLDDKTEFTGYESCRAPVRIIRLIAGGDSVCELNVGLGAVVLDKTPFYPESGGQLTDTGVIVTDSGKFTVEHVKKIHETIVHFGKVSEGKLTPGEAQARVDQARRYGMMRAHTATHLLQAALRTILGTHVTQQGSLVDCDRFRFDFTHFKGVSARELARIEEAVNAYILADSSIDKKVMSYDEAKKEKALAFFEEKYTDSVRVVTVGDYSKEFCGGTHLDHTSQIGSFCVLAESSVSSGIRRIEAVVGKAAYETLRGYRGLVSELSQKLKSPEDVLLDRIDALQAELKKKADKIDNLEKESLAQSVDDIIARNTHKEGDISIVIASFRDKEMNQLLHVSDLIRKKVPDAFVFLVSFGSENRFVAGITGELEKKGLSCKKFVSNYKEKLGLRGGGRPSLCQGTITEKSGGDELGKKVLDCVKEYITQ